MQNEVSILTDLVVVMNLHRVPLAVADASQDERRNCGLGFSWGTTAGVRRWTQAVQTAARGPFVERGLIVCGPWLQLKNDTNVQMLM